MDASVLSLLSKLARDPQLARQMLHQGLEDALGQVKAIKPLELHSLGNEVMEAVMGSVATLPGSSFLEREQPQREWEASTATPMGMGDLARPLEDEFALALTSGNTRFTTPAPAHFSMPPVSSSTFAWSPARPRPTERAPPGSGLRTQESNIRGRSGGYYKIKILVRNII